MALFFHEETDYSNGARKTGFARYRELLERDFMHFIILNLITLIGFLPLIIGISYAILSSSLLILLPVCLFGGAIAGPFFSGLIDMLFRCMRDQSSHYIKNYTHAMKQNLTEAMITGAITFLFIGIYIFIGMIWWTIGFPSFFQLLILFVSLCFVMSTLTIYWIQLVLFKQSFSKRLLNSILFLIKYFLNIFDVTLLQIGYWLIFILFLPYTLLLIPVLGMWFILFLVTFLLYNAVNDAFSLEETIKKEFPDQAVFYETDKEWLDKHNKM